MGPRFVARKFLVAWPVDQSRMSFRCSARSSTSLRCFQSPCMSRMAKDVMNSKYGMRACLQGADLASDFCGGKAESGQGRANNHNTQYASKIFWSA
jgi:hypothetical protein